MFTVSESECQIIESRKYDKAEWISFDQLRLMANDKTLVNPSSLRVFWESAFDLLKIGPRFTPSEAMAIVGLRDKQVINWFNRAEIALDAHRDRPTPRKHRRYSALDLLRLSLISIFLRTGFDLAKANIHMKDLVEKGVHSGKIDIMEDVHLEIDVDEIKRRIYLKAQELLRKRHR